MYIIHICMYVPVDYNFDLSCCFHSCFDFVDSEIVKIDYLD